MKFANQKKGFLNILWILILCLVWFAIGWIANSRFRNPEYQIIESAYELISKDSFYNHLSKRELSYAAIRGMLDSINDPYAELIEPAAAEGLLDTFAGKTGVVGLYAENSGGQVVILTVFPDGPAEMVGIKSGDIVLSIDGTPLDEDSDSSETGLLIRGAPGIPVSLEVQRGDQVLEYSLVRQERDFVTTRMLLDDIGYISLDAFNEVASQKMKLELQSLLDNQPSSLIWDLRNNEGGDMQAAQKIISYFIEDGLLFSAELTQDRLVKFNANGNAIAPDIPLVVLIDGSSYSAAETAAAAVAERGRGITIGSPSYGKGLIQSSVPLPAGNLLQFTIAKWLSYYGEWFHERGVTPQIEVYDDPATDVDEVLEKAVEILQSSP
jgi:carboxyl-terminal processing protease